MLDFLFSKKTKQPEKTNEYLRHTNITDYVVIDIETSGFRPELHKIIEIAAIKVINGRPVASYHSLINYKGNLNPEIVSLTGINVDSLKNAPDRKKVLLEFYDFVGDHILVGHNITKFDNKFLWFSALAAGLTPKKNGLIDTLDIARTTLALNSYKLEYVCNELGIEVKNAHRALDDATLTLMLFEKISKKISSAIEPIYIEYKSSSPFGQKIDAKCITKKSNIDSEFILNKTFCVTSFQPFYTFQKESDLQQFIVDAGGRMSNNLTLKTDYLIDCDPVYVSGKEKKALEYIKQGKSIVKIVSSDEFLTLAELK